MGVSKSVRTAAHEDIGSSLCIGTQRALPRIHSHVVDLETAHSVVHFHRHETFLNLSGVSRTVKILRF
jgi:hypothetical protein